MKEVVLAVFSIFLCQVHAASFDCSKASSFSEMAICNNPELSKLDSELGVIYKKAENKASDKNIFKQQSYASWKWREKNCYSEKCLFSWYSQRKTILNRIINNNKNIYKYEPEVVYLSGTLISALGQTPNGNSVSYPAIQLDSPITVEGSPNDLFNSQTEFGLLLLQLSLDENLLKKFRSLKKKEVKIGGTLYHSHTAHHHTKVVLSAVNISKKN